MKTIRLTTPPQSENQNDSVELDAGNLERWLKSLRGGDIIETVARLDEAISGFNEVIVPADNRLKLLEIYFTAFHHNLQGYDEMRLAQLKVSTKQKHELASDIMWLYIKLSHGYKIIVKDHVGTPNSSKPPQYLLLAVFRAMELTMISLIYSCRFGLSAPPLTYIEMHQLYEFAEYYELSEKSVKAASGYAKTPTIASYYALAMIFINIDPAQYESYTLEVLFLALQPFTFGCPITRATENSADSYIFRIKLYENQIPVVVADEDTTRAKDKIRYLNIGKFLDKLQRWIDDNKNNSDTLLIEHELELFPGVITHLETIRSERKKQLEESRTGPIENQSVKLIFGFGPLESLLIVKSAELGLRLNYNISEWAVQSQSATGCELASHLDLVTDELSLGDLVAMVKGGEEDEPVTLVTIACLSRLQQQDQGVLLAGLEYMNGDASPLTYLKVNEEGEAVDGVQANGIFLMKESSGEKSPIMIVSRNHYQEQQHYLVKTQEKVCTVVADKLVRQTLRYAFFNYKILKEEPLKVQEPANVLDLAM